jgi:hypothetical protein
MTRFFRSYKFEVPCVEGFGSCMYTDFCKIFPLSECPEFFKAPHVSAGVYHYEKLEADIDFPIKVPAGMYSMRANFFTEALGNIGCVEIFVNIA